MKFTTKQLQQQFKGFLRTNALFSDSGVLPYSNFVLNSSVDFKLNSSHEKELSGQLYVGKRMEIFFKAYIENSKNLNLVTHSLQVVNDKKKTLGELDFIIENQPNFLHIELVYKFYIYDPTYHRNSLHCFMGPKRKDFLYKKIEKLRNHQFPMLFNAFTQKQLKELALPTSHYEQKLSFMAKVFLPLNKAVNLPSYINPKTVSGFWLKFSELKLLNKFHHYFIPKRQDWMTIPSESDYTFEDFESIEMQVNVLIKSGIRPMLWEKTKEGKFNSYFVCFD